MRLKILSRKKVKILTGFRSWDSNIQAPITIRCQFTSTRTVNTMITSDGLPLLFAGSHNGLIGAYSLKQDDTYGMLMSSYNSGLDVTAVLIVNEPDFF